MDISAKQVMELRKVTGLPMMKCKQALIETEGDHEKAIELLRKEGLKSAAKKADRVTGEGLMRLRISDDGSKATAVLVLCETEPVKNTPMFVEFVDTLADKCHEQGIDSAEAANALPWNDEFATAEDALKGLIARIGENMKIGKVQTFTQEGEGVVGGYVHHNQKEGGLVSLSSADADQAKELGMHIVFAKPTVLTRDEVAADDVEKELRFLREQIAEDESMKGKPEQAIEGILQGRLSKNFFGQTVLTEQTWFSDASTTVAKKMKEWGTDLVGFAHFRAGA